MGEEQEGEAVAAVLSDGPSERPSRNWPMPLCGAEQGARGHKQFHPRLAAMMATHEKFHVRLFKFSLNR